MKKDFGEELLTQIEREGVEGYEVVHRGKWEDEGKYQYQDIVFLHGGKHWIFCVTRSGSYFSEYNFEYPSIAHEAELKVVRLETWVRAR
mgnify:CR=1 FL=1